MRINDKFILLLLENHYEKKELCYVHLKYGYLIKTYKHAL